MKINKLHKSIYTSTILGIILFISPFNTFSQDIEIGQKELFFPAILKYTTPLNTELNPTTLPELYTDLPSSLRDFDDENKIYSTNFWGPEVTTYFDGKTLNLNIKDYTTFCLKLVESSQFKDQKELQEIRNYLVNMSKETLETSMYYPKLKTWKDTYGFKGQIDYVATLIEEIINKTVSAPACEPRIIRNLLILYRKGVYAPGLDMELNKKLSLKYFDTIYQYCTGYVLDDRIAARNLDYQYADASFIASIWLTGKLDPANPDIKKLSQYLARNFERFSQLTQKYLANSSCNKITVEKRYIGNEQMTYWRIEKQIDAESIIDIPLLKYILLQKLAISGITEISIPEKLKEKYNNLSYIRPQDYRAYMAETLGSWNRAYLATKFNQEPNNNCMNDYFKSNEIDIRDKKISYENWTLFNLENLLVYAYQDNPTTLQINIEYENKELKNTLSGGLLNNYQITEQKFKAKINEREKLSIDQLNSLGQAVLTNQDFVKKIDDFLSNCNQIFPLLFRDEKELESILKDISNDLEEFKVVQEKFKDLDKNISPKTASAITKLKFKPAHPYLISQLDKSSGYLKVLAEYLKKNNEEYTQAAENLSNEFKNQYQTYIKQYQESLNVQKSDFKDLNEYFNYYYNLFSQKSGSPQFLSGITAYIVDNAYSRYNSYSNTIEGNCRLDWSSENDIKLSGTIYPNGGAPITAKYTGRIVKNSDKDIDNDQWPYVFITSEKQKFYISFSKGECYSYLVFRGTGVNSPIAFSFKFSF